jgi:hypothetical protein
VQDFALHRYCVNNVCAVLWEASCLALLTKSRWQQLDCQVAQAGKLSFAGEGGGWRGAKGRRSGVPRQRHRRVAGRTSHELLLTMQLLPCSMLAVVLPKRRAVKQAQAAAGMGLRDDGAASRGNSSASNVVPRLPSGVQRLRPGPNLDAGERLGLLQRRTCFIGVDRCCGGFKSC